MIPGRDESPLPCLGDTSPEKVRTTEKAVALHHH